MVRYNQWIKLIWLDSNGWEISTAVHFRYWSWDPSAAIQLGSNEIISTDIKKRDKRNTF